QAMASETLLFPQPFGPTIAVTPDSFTNISPFSKKDLNPTNSIRRSLSTDVSYTPCGHRCRRRLTPPAPAEARAYIQHPHQTILGRQIGSHARKTRTIGRAMKISAKDEYACSAVLELAMNYSSDAPVRVQDIADRHGIPLKFLFQIMQILK